MTGRPSNGGPPEAGKKGCRHLNIGRLAQKIWFNQRARRVAWAVGLGRILGTAGGASAGKRLSFDGAEGLRREMDMKRLLLGSALACALLLLSACPDAKLPTPSPKVPEPKARPIAQFGANTLYVRGLAPAELTAGAHRT